MRSSLARRVPHCEQKRASSGFCLPQAVQNGIGLPPGQMVGLANPHRGLRLTVAPNLSVGGEPVKEDRPVAAAAVSRPRVRLVGADVHAGRRPRLASEGTTSNSQPSPYGSLLTSSGVASSAALLATTSPVTGA